MLLTTLDILYIVLTLFTAIIGTLVTIVLIRAIKILGVISEITDYYYKIKEYLGYYSQIPNIVKEKVFDLIGRKK